MTTHRSIATAIAMTSLRAVCAGTAATLAVTAQCQPTFESGSGVTGFWRTGTSQAAVTTACLWDADGPGPLTPRLVCAGSFEVAGEIASPKLVAYDPANGTWQTIGNALSGQVEIRALLALPNGELLVGGSFTTIDGVAAAGLARWDGTAWSAIGNGPGSGVRSLATLPNGDLVAANASGIHRWNGSQWQAIATNLLGSIDVMVVTPSGELVVGGDFHSIAGIGAHDLARWNGVAWSAFPILPADPSGSTTAILPLANGDLIVASHYAVRRFDGNQWTLLGPTALYGSFTALLPLPNGELLAAGGAFLGAGQTTYGLHRWSSTGWQAISHPLDAPVLCAAALPSQHVFLGGYFARAGFQLLEGGAIWDGGGYLPLGRGTDGTVRVVAVGTDGSRIAAGDFTILAGITCNRVARNTGGTWHALANGVDADVHAAVVLTNGDVVVGGAFQQASGTVARHIARWDGAAWRPLASGCNWFVHSLAVLDNGELVAGGEFTTAGGVPAQRVARWNGSGWQELGGGINGRVLVLHALANGDLVAGGEFTIAGGNAARNIARWDGVHWHPLGVGIPFAVGAIAARPDGTLLATGPSYAYQNTIFRWDGVAWTSVVTSPLGPVHGLQTLPGGDVVAVGAFTAIGGAAAQRIARWDGIGWRAFADGPDADVRAVAVAPDGAIVVGGTFTRTGSVISTRYAELVPPCAARATPYGVACDTSAGTLHLAAEHLAWLGDAAMLVATGMPADAVGLALTGFTPVSISLSAIHPAGGPNCSLLTMPDIATLLPPGPANAQWTVAVPSVAALIGIRFHSQLLTAETDTVGQLALAGSNGVTSTIGSY